MRGASWMTGPLVLMAGALLLVAAPTTVPAAPPSGEPVQTADPGKALFEGKGNCFTCHGPAAKGTPLGPDLTDGEWVNFEARPTRSELEALVKDGVTKPVSYPAPMPPMGGARLSPEEIGQLADYVLSLSAATD